MGVLAALVLLATVCAFVMGYSVNQTTTCAVSAAKEIVHQRKATMFTGFVVAMSVAGLISIPLSWVVGSSIHLAQDTTIGWSLMIGAVLLGLGAVINDACLLGTLSRIGQGEVRFLALPLGLGLGFALADHQTWLAPEAQSANPLAVPTPSGWAVVAGFAVLLGLALWQLRRTAHPPKSGRWSTRQAMLLLGLCGALLFSVTPGWTYADTVHMIVSRGDLELMAGFGVFSAAVAALAGALVSGLRARLFVWQRPTVGTAARSIVGGAVMAFGATLVPGGNDTLLLAAVPAGTVSGLLAYTIMSLTVPAVLVALRYVNRPSRLQAV